MDNKEIGERIRKVREKKNITRDRIADAIGISAKFLYEVEMGKKGLSAKTLFKLSQALSVSCEYIMCGSSKYKKHSKRLNELIDILMQFNNAQITQVTKIIKDIYDMV